MRSDKSFARSLTHVAVVNLLIIVSCWAQKPQKTQSAVPPLPVDIPGTADRYSVLIMGNLAGQQAIWTAPDGSLHIFYQYNDRGRGPKTTSTLKLDAKGVPVAESVNGNDLPEIASSRKLHARIRYRSLEERLRRGREETD
jgi:hypothetical protein